MKTTQLQSSWKQLETNYLFQHIKQATRQRDGERDSILDLVFHKTRKIWWKNIEYMPPIGKSDHVVVKFDIKLYIDKPPHSAERYNFFKGNYGEINENLARVDWESVISDEPSINEGWVRLTDKINNEYKENIPVCKAHDKKYDTPWMSTAARDAVKNKRRRWLKYANQRNDENKDVYTRARNKSKY